MFRPSFALIFLTKTKETLMETAKPKLHRAWLVLVGCCFMQAGAFGIVLSSCGVFFNPICQELGFSQGSISAYLTFYSWASCLGMLFVSKLFYKSDSRKTISICVIILAVTFGLMGTFTQLWQWYAAGAVFGIAGSFVFVVPTPILLGNWFHKKTGLVTGIATACSGIGGAIFAPTLTALIEQFGWRYAYIIAAVCVLIICLPFTTTVLHFNPASIGTKPYGWEESEETVGGKKAAANAPISERTTKALVCTVPFICLFLATGFGSSFSGYNNQLPTYALTIGETAMFGAAMLSTTQVGNIFFKIVVGMGIDKFGALKTTIVQCLIVTAAFMVFIFSKNYIALFVAAFFFGSHNSLISLNIPALFRFIYTEKEYARLLPLSQIGTGIIGGIGIPLVAVAYDMYGNFDLAFMVGAGICLFFALMCLIACNKKFRQK